MDRKKSDSGRLAVLILWGLVFLAPLSAGAIDNAGHGTGNGGHDSGYIGGESGIGGHAMGITPAQGVLDIRNMTMSDDIGTGHHAGAYHGGAGGNSGDVRGMVVEPDSNRDWDDHHGSAYGGGSPNSGSSRYQGNTHHYNNGGAMGGMH